ncbi:hypothetical protein [Marinobacterium sp. MBR-109]|jgi:hypothetical protein|uniref:hypothetical protein n=1 Tax=Marinobacterium sp. MBR-109 TaxID=3156462 RepID=UPI003396E152
MYIKSIILALSLFSTAAYGFDTFNHESNRMTHLLSCDNPKYIPSSKYANKLYSCIGGKSDSVKIFINADSDQKSIKNIKFMWNEYTTTKIPGINMQDGKNIAHDWLIKISDHYFPTHKNKILKKFFSEKNNFEFTDGRYLIKYTFFEGPSINERLLIISSY